MAWLIAARYGRPDLGPDRGWSGRVPWGLGSSLHTAVEPEPSVRARGEFTLHPSSRALLSPSCNSISKRGKGGEGAGAGGAIEDSSLSESCQWRVIRTAIAFRAEVLCALVGSAASACSGPALSSQRQRMDGGDSDFRQMDVIVRAKFSFR